MLLLWTTPAWARPGFGHGREQDILKLIEPFHDEGPIGSAKLQAISIERDRVVFRLQLADASAELRLIPKESATDRAFDLELAPATGELRQAQLQLQQAIERHDDGHFFGTGPTVTVGDEPSQNRLYWLRILTALLWLTLASATIWRLWRTPWRWSSVLFTCFIAWLAMRSALPWTPLHANGHAFEDIAVALAAPDAGLSTDRAVGEYGPAWVLAQQWTLGWMGATYANLIQWSHVVMSLVSIALWRALRAAGSGRPSAALALAILLTAPVVARLGSSESPVLLGLLLMTVALWLASSAHVGDRIGTCVAILLVALGHPLGPGFAAGTALAAWGLAPVAGRPMFHRRERVKQPKDQAVASTSTPSSQLVLAEFRHAVWSSAEDAPPEQSLPTSQTLVPVWGLLLAVTAVAGLGIQLLGNAALLSRRTAVAGALPIPTDPFAFWLWFDGAWAPASWQVLVLLGAGGLIANAKGWLRIRAVALPLGTLVVVASGLLVVACISDALRYQALALPLLALLAVRAGDGVPPGRTMRWAVLVMRGVATMAAVVELLSSMPGRVAQDGQAQAFSAVQPTLQAQRGTVWFVQPERNGSQRVVVEPPLGLLGAAGPDMRAISLGRLQSLCDSHSELPQPLWIWLPPDCDAQAVDGAKSVCAQLAAFAHGPPLAAGPVTWLPARDALGLPGEFHKHAGTTGQWSLREAGCGGSMGRNGG